MVVQGAPMFMFDVAVIIATQPSQKRNIILKILQDQRLLYPHRCVHVVHGLYAILWKAWLEAADVSRNIWT